MDYTVLRGQPGSRVPHLWVEHQGQRVSTLDIIGHHFVLLIGPDGAVWYQAARECAAHFGIELPVYSIGPEGDLSASEEIWRQATDLPDHGMLLVRPDGFVAARVSGSEPDEDRSQQLVNMLSALHVRRRCTLKRGIGEQRGKMSGGGQNGRVNRDVGSALSVRGVVARSLTKKRAQLLSGK